MVLDGTPFLSPSFLWGATAIGGIVVAWILSQDEDPEVRRGWTFALFAAFIIYIILSPFGPMGP